MAQVQELEWDEVNEEHAWAHGLTPTIAEEVLTNTPIFLRNKKGLAGTHLVVGPDRHGRFWTFSILPTRRSGVWRPITGWPSSKGEVVRYGQHQPKEGSGDGEAEEQDELGDDAGSGADA